MAALRVAAGRPHVGQRLRVGHVHHHVVVATVFADHLPFIHFATPGDTNSVPDRPSIE